MAAFTLARALVHDRHETSQCSKVGVSISTRTDGLCDSFTNPSEISVSSQFEETSCGVISRLIVHSLTFAHSSSHLQPTALIPAWYPASETIERETSQLLTTCACCSCIPTSMEWSTSGRKCLSRKGREVCYVTALASARLYCHLVHLK